MAKGISLHIGVEKVDPTHYFDADGNGWEGFLPCAEKDALDLAEIARSYKFDIQYLLTRCATRDAVKKAVESAAEKLDAGDFFLLTYSGHGGQLPDLFEFKKKEADGMDETWCLYDGQLIDDELYVFWSKFKEGVRVLMLSDSCHSGTVAKNIGQGGDPNPSSSRSRNMPRGNVSTTYRKNQTFYEELAESVPQDVEVLCHLVMISGCQDAELSYEGKVNGRFTKQVTKLLNSGDSGKDYREFHKLITDGLAEIKPEDEKQTPNIMLFPEEGNVLVDQAPFEI